MSRMKRAIFALAATTALAACGVPEDEPAATANEASAPEAAVTPYSEAEQRMSEEMMAAAGVDVGDNWAKKMVPHHQGAIDMSQVVLQQNPTEAVADMARQTIEKQGKEIETIRKLFKTGDPNQQSADLYRTAMMDMHAKMQTATGADASETYLRKMLEHHRGAVAMSDIALKNGVNGALRDQVQKTRDDQEKEVEMVEAMLRGDTMTHSVSEPSAAPSQAAAMTPKPAASAKPQPKATPTATKASPKATPAAEPSPSATPSCAPEHRAAGHC